MRTHLEWWVRITIKIYTWPSGLTIEFLFDINNVELLFIHIDLLNWIIWTYITLFIWELFIHIAFRISIGRLLYIYNWLMALQINGWSWTWLHNHFTHHYRITWLALLVYMA